MCLIVPSPYPRLIMLRHRCWESSLVKSFVRSWRTGAGKHLYNRSTGDQAASLQPATQTRLIFLFVRSNRKLWGCPAFFARDLLARKRAQWVEGNSRRTRKRKARQTGVCVCVFVRCVFGRVDVLSLRMLLYKLPAVRLIIPHDIDRCMYKASGL